METTLRIFYARAFGLVLLIAALLVAMLMLAAPAFAQDAAPEAAKPDFIGLIFSTTSAAIYWLLGLVWVALKPPAWIKDFFATKDAFHWDGIIDTGLTRAEALVRQWGVDATKDKSGWITAMAAAVNTFNPEIADYFDKNRNGVIDFMEGYIPPRDPKKAGISPGLVALIATRLPEGAADAAPQSFMAAPETGRRGVAPVKPRASDGAVNRLAGLPRGATKQ